MSNNNVALARRWFEEVWNQHRAETIDELVDPEGICHSESGELCGPAEFKERVYAIHLSAFPDMKTTIEDTLAEGDNVVVRWVATGTHSGDGLGFAASGRPFTVRGMTWIRFRDGKMVEGWDCWNQAAVIQSLRSPASEAGPSPH